MGKDDPLVHCVLTLFPKLRNCRTQTGKKTSSPANVFLHKEFRYDYKHMCTHTHTHITQVFHPGKVTVSNAVAAQNPLVSVKKPVPLSVTCKLLLCGLLPGCSCFWGTRSSLGQSLPRSLHRCWNKQEGTGRPAPSSGPPEMHSSRRYSLI